MTLARLIAVATVYRQFETRLWAIIGKSLVLQQWNRSNPRLTIAMGVNSASGPLGNLLQKNSSGILAAKQAVFTVVQAKIAADQKLLPDERKELQLLAIRYLNAIDPAVWMLLASSKDPAQAQALAVELQRLLIQYVGRSELPEYLALMVVELVVIMGKVSGGEDGDTESGGQVFVAYEMGSLKKSQEERTKVKIQVGTEAQDFEDLKSLFEQEGGRRSLDSFMASGSRREGNLVADALSGMEEPGGDLGVYYLSCLKDACKKMDISIDSFVNLIPHTKRTQTNLVLTI